MLTESWRCFFHPFQSLRCGTTGVVTFIRGNMLHVAWLGDSQVMLVRRGQAVELMKPHKPDREVRTACFQYPRAAFSTEADGYQLYVRRWDAERCFASVCSSSLGWFGSWCGFVCKSFVLISPRRVCENPRYLWERSECSGSTRCSVQTTLALSRCLGREEAH